MSGCPQSSGEGDRCSTGLGWHRSSPVRNSVDGPVGGCGAGATSCSNSNGGDQRCTRSYCHTDLSIAGTAPAQLSRPNIDEGDACDTALPVLAPVVAPHTNHTGSYEHFFIRPMVTGHTSNSAHKNHLPGRRTLLPLHFLCTAAPSKSVTVHSTAGPTTGQQICDEKPLLDSSPAINEHETVYFLVNIGCDNFSFS